MIGPGWNVVWNALMILKHSGNVNWSGIVCVLDAELNNWKFRSGRTIFYVELGHILIMHVRDVRDFFSKNVTRMKLENVN